MTAPALTPPRTVSEGPAPALDSRTTRTDTAPVITWALSKISEERIKRARGIVDSTEVGDSMALITALGTLAALKVSGERTVGWNREEAA